MHREGEVESGNERKSVSLEGIDSLLSINRHPEGPRFIMKEKGKREKERRRECED